MRRVLLAFVLALCGLAPVQAAPPNAPKRIVSLDYCADQFVLGIADRSQIAALSYGADKDDSYYRGRALGLGRTRGSLEETLALQPDLIVRNWGGGFSAEATYARFHIPVLTLGDSATFAEARAQLLQAAHAFGQDARGAAMAKDLDARLAMLSSQTPSTRPRATPGCGARPRSPVVREGS